MTPMSADFPKAADSSHLRASAPSADPSFALGNSAPVLNPTPTTSARNSPLILAKSALFASVAALALLGTGCSSPQICARPVAKSDPAAKAVLRASQDAHGGKAFAALKDLSVRYEGRWGPIGPRFQPVLSDRGFRRDSEERLIISTRTLAQEHTGPAGKKHVLREGRGVQVAYNGSPATPGESTEAAALVADAYTMFLLGPFYFNRPGVTLASDGADKVNGAQCDRMLAVLRPGFGSAPEDRVVLYVDRATKRLLRVRMTLNGLESTRGAEVDITFRDFRYLGGVWWPTDFDERIREPFDLHAHHWRITGLDFNRALRPTDLTPTRWSAKASRPATPIPSQAKP